MVEKDFIQDLYKEKARNDSNSKSLANLLNILTKTVFGDANRFVFELLQNADDSPKENGIINVQVEFRLLDKYLIFSHTGKHFSADDVKGISNVGSGDSGKTKDIEKTGYKGIGFKSIFGTCNCVQILSNKYSFKFDRYHYLWKDVDGYPWQIIPVWVESTDIEKEVLERLNIENVNTIISINDKNKTGYEIKEVFKDPRIVLFLRHISSVTFYDNDIQVFRIECKPTNNGFKEIYVNGVLKSCWISKEFIVSVDEEVHKKVKNLDPAVCPEKLKEATTTKLAFAAQYEHETIKDIADAVFYCYLPTKVQYNFPFLINGDFITNAERTQFLENEWNGFLFKKIAYCKIQWLSELAQSRIFKYQFAKLIRHKFTYVYSSIIFMAYNAGLDEAILNIPFIPQQNNQESLLKIGECILDYTGFCNIFGTEIVTSYHKNIYLIADCKIQNLSKIASLGAKIFDINNLCEILSSNEFTKKSSQNITFQLNLVQFLYSITCNNPDWLAHVKSTPFLIDENYRLNSPEEIYFPLREEVKDISQVIEFRYINSNLFESIKANKDLLNWLSMLGVKESSYIEVVRRSIYKMIEENRIDNGNVLEIGRFVFKVFLKGKLNDNDYNKLSKLKLLTNKGTLEVPINCYLLDYYEPELKIQDVFPEGNYASEEYVQGESEITQWKRFFTRIGVKERISVNIENGSFERMELIKKYPFFKHYFDYIDANDFYPSITRPYITNRQHGLTNIVFIDFLNYLHNYSFAKSFWKIILENYWHQLYSGCKKAMYYTRLGEVPIESYFEYFIKNNSCIPANDGKCYKSIEVYSSSLKRVIGSFYPIADFEINLSKEQDEFLCIKRTLPIQDCLKILKKIDTREINSDIISQIEAVYKQLIKSITEHQNPNEVTLEWSGKLLATNNTFQDSSILHCFGVKQLLPPSDSKYFLKLSEQIKNDDLEILCSIFDIPIVKYNDLQFIPEDIEVENDLYNTLISKVNYFASLVANTSNEDQYKFSIKIHQKIKHSVFYRAQSLSLGYLSKERGMIYQQKIESWFDICSSRLYYVGKWNSPLTLYSLSSALCSFLELKDKERELALILQLSNLEVEGWLKAKGYKITEINENEETEFSNDDITYTADNNSFGKNAFEESVVRETSPESRSPVRQNDENDNSMINMDIKEASSNNRDYKNYRIERHDQIPGEENNHKHDSFYNQDNTLNTKRIYENLHQSKKTYRLISYVSDDINNKDLEKTQCAEKSEYKFNIDEKAKKAVFKYEESAGRIPAERVESHESCDIISCNKENGEIERFIIVNGFNGEWSNFDAALLSAEQMKMAKVNGDKFWLYVVEFVEEDENMRIHRISNPYERITSYAFDHGWRAVAEQDDPIDKFVIGARIEHKVYGLGSIKDVIEKGRSRLLIIIFNNVEKKIPLNLTQMKIVGDN